MVLRGLMGTDWERFIQHEKVLMRPPCRRFSVLLGLYRDYMGMMEKKMETTGII